MSSTPTQLARMCRFLAILILPLFAQMAVYPAASGKDIQQEPLPLIELRQYVLYPGKLDGFTSLFESQFVESQEAVGMRIIGTFHEPVHPSHFTWIRGFPDMDSRPKYLDAFYSGPVWRTYRDQANPSLEDNDNVLLLREAFPGSGFPVPKTSRASPGSTTPPGGWVVATIYYLKGDSPASFARYFKETLVPEFQRAGINTLACFVPEQTPNNFPKLKIREGESVFVWFARFNDSKDYQAHLAELAKQATWRDHLAAALTARLNSPPEILELQPTARSALH